MAEANSKKKAQARDLKHRVLTCLHKLSDRDTHSVAASELESIAKSLSAENLPSFISSIAATDSSDKSPVRRQCLRLISILSDHHGNSLSPYLSKVLSAVVRRLRDPDSAVRAACVAASVSLSANLTAPPFTSITKPFLETLFTDQDLNTQIGAALCLASIVDNHGSPDLGCLKRLLPRFEKLVKCDSFKAKAALLTLIGSVAEVQGVLSGGKNLIRNLVMCLMEFVSNDDWAARKASAEALMKIAVAEKYELSEYKLSCLKTFEAKRYDKVKAVRETMNQMIEAWKGIPDLSEEGSPPPESLSSSKENASDGRYPPGSIMGSGTPQIKRRSPVNLTASKSPSVNGFSATPTRKKGLLGNNDKKNCPAMFRKLDHKKHTDCKVEIAAPLESFDTPASEDKSILDQGMLNNADDGQKFLKQGTRRSLFKDNSNEQRHKFGMMRAGSRVVPVDGDSVVVSNETGDLCGNQRDSEDLSLIRKQLVQIENQQSNLLDILQRFIGRSETGMRSLETRVHSLELALDDISFDLAVSTGRISRTDSAAMCCKLPGAEFFSSKLWRKNEGRSLIPQFPASRGTRSLAETHNMTDRYGTEGIKLENRRYGLQGGRGFIMNPLASDGQGSSEISFSRDLKNVQHAT